MRMRRCFVFLYGCGVVLFLLAVFSPCSRARAAEKPTYYLDERTWDSITMCVTFTSDSAYNRMKLTSSSDSSENSVSDVMYSKGKYFYTFKNLKNPGSLYYITICYGDNQSLKYNVRTLKIPQGEHVRLDVDFVKYIKGNISYSNLIRWLGHLDTAYNSYYNLVGAKPNNGNVINIVSSSESHGCMWIYPNTSTIYWKEDYIADGLRQIDKYDDWHFGILHEIGHLFDLNNIWTFDAEFFANFKMAYVFYRQDGNFRVLINDKIVTQYSEIVDFYYSGSRWAYTKTICADPMTYTADGLTYMFLNGIKEFGSWSAIKGAFEYYIDVGKQSGEPAPIDSFLDIVSYFTSNSNPFSYAFSRYYGDQYRFVVAYLNRGSRQRSVGSDIIID